jgi:hypothetical protein
MASKRAASASAGGPAAVLASPLANAVLLGAAVTYGLWLLVDRGRLSLPPSQLLASIYTVSGCLALVGPLVLFRKDGGGSGLGELLWMTGGVLVWVFDVAALIAGNSRALAWTTPLGYQPMGLTILAVLVAGWRHHAGERDWSWTNVIGWLLGLFWISMGLLSLMPVLGLDLRRCSTGPPRLTV